MSLDIKVGPPMIDVYVDLYSETAILMIYLKILITALTTTMQGSKGSVTEMHTCETSTKTGLGN